MDPISATTTVITLATFIKDLIEVGQSIKQSIEKVGENRRRIRELTNDILHTLADIANLSRGHEDQFQAPALLGALGNLKADMLHVLSVCRNISPERPSPGFRGFKSQIKAWVDRDDVEAKIRRLKEHVYKCYLQFTAFSAARIEQTTARIEDTTLQTVNTSLRVEQAVIVNGAENQVTLRRVEGLMARVLMNTQFGQNVLNRTIEIIASDTTHHTLEFQYLSAQAFRLVDCLQQLATNTALVLDAPLEDVRGFVFSKSVSPQNLLYEILGMMLRLGDSPAEIPFTSIKDVLHLGSHLAHLGMTSEATASYLAAIQILGRLSDGIFNSAVLPHLAVSSINLSDEYGYQLRWDLASETSKQAMDLCHIWQENSPDMDNLPLLVAVLITHSKNMCATGQPEAAISFAQEAITLGRPMVGTFIQSGSQTSYWSERDTFKAVKLSQAFFALAAALSSAGRYFEAYQTIQEGFQTILNFPLSVHSHFGTDIDTFIDHICKVAEGGGFSLAMLTDDVVLFRDLSRIYPEEFSSQFLRLLYAHAYLSQQKHSPDAGASLKKLRIFLEPDSSSPPPMLKPSSNFARYIEGFNVHGGIIEDTFRAFYIRPSQITIPAVIRNIFVGQFDQAIVVLRGVVRSACSHLSFNSTTLMWVLYNILDILPFVSKPKQLTLLQIMPKIVKHFGTIIKSARPETREGLLDVVFRETVYALWSVGLLSDALAVSDAAIEYLCSSSEFDDSDDKLRWFQLRRTFLLCEMARIPEAVETMRQTKPFPAAMPEAAQNDEDFFIPYTIQARILRRTGRNREAIRTLRRVVSETSIKYWIEDGQVFDLHLYLLLAELPAAGKRVRRRGEAVKDAKRAVTICRQDIDDSHAQGRKCALTHSLTTLSNCLAAVGRNDEALLAAKEATSMYTLNASHMWGNFLYTIRRQELGANTFHSLSLRLAKAGERDEALSNAEKATALYRECVSLAPRYLPDLSNGLKHLASMLYSVGRVDDAIRACEEAVSIVRKVADIETYFLGSLGEGLDQLARYLFEKGHTKRAAAAMSEAAQVRRRTALLPPEADFLFDGGGQSRQTAPESEEKADASNAAVVIEGEGSEATSAISSQDALSTSEISTPDSCIKLGLQAGDESCEENAAIDTLNPRKIRVADVLSRPLDVNLSTPMDLLSWILVAILGMALAVVWSRVP